VHITYLDATLRGLPVILIGMLLSVAGCGSQGGSGALGDLAGGETGLEGVVLRGPIQPVCMVDQPCDAPFSAAFVVSQGDREIARFRSDSAGHFRVALPPGGYSVVPEDSAPLMFPHLQRHEVEVGSEGYTTVTLSFDTGIR